MIWIFVALFVLLVILAIVLARPALFVAGGIMAVAVGGGDKHLSDFDKVQIIAVKTHDQLRNIISHSAADLILIEGIDAALGMSPDVQNVYGKHDAQNDSLAAIAAVQSTGKNWRGAEGSYDDYVKQAVRKFGKETVMHSLFFRELADNIAKYADAYAKVVPVGDTQYDGMWLLVRHAMGQSSFHQHLRELFDRHGFKYTEKFAQELLNKYSTTSPDLFLSFGDPSSFLKTLKPTQKAAKFIYDLTTSQIIDNIAKYRQSYDNILCVVTEPRLAELLKKVK